MFSIGMAIKMYKATLDKKIEDKGGVLSFTSNEIEAYLLKEKIPYRLNIRVDNSLIDNIKVEIRKRDVK